MRLLNMKTDHESAFVSEQVNRFESYLSAVCRLSFNTDTPRAVQ